MWDEKSFVFEKIRDLLQENIKNEYIIDFRVSTQVLTTELVRYPRACNSIHYVLDRINYLQVFILRD